MNLSRTLALAVIVGGAAHAEAKTVQCHNTDESEIAALFDAWNAALATRDPARVADRYAPESILLPTVSNVPRTTREARVDYFTSFLRNKPQGAIDSQQVQFTYGWDGKRWLITSHHSFVMPEATAK